MGISEKGGRKKSLPTRSTPKSPRVRRVDKDEEMELETPEDIFGSTTPENQEKDGGFFSAMGDIGSVGPAVSNLLFFSIT
jgi:hypothetical protein